MHKTAASPDQPHKPIQQTHPAITEQHMAKQSPGSPPSLDTPPDTQAPPPNPDLNPDHLWKARAEQAEEEIKQLQLQIQDLQTQLASAHTAIDQIERKGTIDAQLTAANAIDIEIARLLTEAAIADMDQPDIALAVRELKDRKPFLFTAQQPQHHPSASMMPSPQPRPDTQLDDIALRARSSGDRSELLRYLRARRTT